MTGALNIMPLIHRDTSPSRLTWAARGRCRGTELFGGYAASPIVVPSSDPDVCDVYITARNREGRGMIVRGTLQWSSNTWLADPSGVVLTPGEPGMFDFDGCTGSCIVENDGKLFLFYTGWLRGGSIPFIMQIGMAVSDDQGKTFHRWSQAPLFPRIPSDPIGNAAATVWKTDLGWDAIYLKYFRWESQGDAWRHHYYLATAKSSDLFSWEKRGDLCVPVHPDEYAMGRASRIENIIDGHQESFFFAARGDAYCLEYAYRDDDGLLKRGNHHHQWPERSDWDSQMQSYPFVWRVGNEIRMIYNGNGYGKTGMGTASALIEG